MVVAEAQKNALEAHNFSYGLGSNLVHCKFWLIQVIEWSQMTTAIIIEGK